MLPVTLDLFGNNSDSWGPASLAKAVKVVQGLPGRAGTSLSAVLSLCSPLGCRFGKVRELTLGGTRAQQAFPALG